LPVATLAEKYRPISPGIIFVAFSSETVLSAQNTRNGVQKAKNNASIVKSRKPAEDCRTIVISKIIVHDSPQICVTKPVECEQSPCQADQKVE
jgi:hypothetical protein